MCTIQYKSYLSVSWFSFVTGVFHKNVLYIYVVRVESDAHIIYVCTIKLAIGSYKC